MGTEPYSAKADAPPTAQAGESGCVPALIVALHSDAEAAPATLAAAVRMKPWGSCVLPGVTNLGLHVYG